MKLCVTVGFIVGILWACGESFGGSGVENAPFHQFRPGETIDLGELAHVLNGKSARALFAGGPLGQPAFHFALHPRPCPAHLVATTTQIDRSANSKLLPPGSSTLDPVEVVDKILDRSLPLPLVYKPNHSSFGRGVIFFEAGVPKDSILLTMALPGSSNDDTPDFFQTARALESLRRNGILRIGPVPEEDLVRITLFRSAPDIRRVLVELLEAVMIHHIDDPHDPIRFVDAGVIEEMMTSYIHHGRSFETRHKWVGDLADGSIELIRHGEDGWNGWLSRVGSSAYFPNWAGRGRADFIPWPNLYRPLYEGFGIPESRQSAFSTYADQYIVDTFRHLRRRLLDSGLRLHGKLKGEVDLKWKPNPNEEFRFPVPILIEARLILLDEIRSPVVHAVEH